jgi:hypothetical protein
VANVDDCSLARSAEVTAAGFVNDPTAFTACDHGQRFLEIAWENGGVIRHAQLAEIVAKQTSANRQAKKDKAGWRLATS